VYQLSEAFGPVTSFNASKKGPGGKLHIFISEPENMGGVQLM
jgi:hypothetical protein